MKKYVIFLLFFIFSFQFLIAQIQEFKIPYSSVKQIVADIPCVSMPKFDVNVLLEEDKSEIFLKPFRFGKVFDVEINSDKDGLWIEENDFRIWMISVKSEKAYSLSLTFSDFELPENSKLFVYNKDKSFIVGALTSENNNLNKTLTVQHIPGDEIIVEYVEPISIVNKTNLNISNVSHDYRDIFHFDEKSSGWCEVDINCDEGEDWQTLKKSVVKFTYNEKISTYLCTGTLVSNTALNSTPYILTAEHCVNEQDVANTTVFYFNYEAENCNGNYNSDEQTMSGATLVATGGVLDFSLVLLNSVPPESYTPYFSGWDVNGITPESTYCIHHPAGDVKKISIDNDAPTTGSFTDYADNSHWLINEWDTGTTEGGSSGSPLFNEDKRIIGDLTGGEASCSSSINDYFQKISKSWSSDTASAKQLKHWLDPLSTNLKTLDSYNPFYGVGLDAPKNLTAEVVEVDDVQLEWNAPLKEFKNDDFEDYSPFTVKLGNWVQLDLDLNQKCSVEDFDFENEGGFGGFSVFDVSATIPVFQQGWEAHSGNKYLACFAANEENQKANKWLISPEFKVEENNVVIFWAKSVSENYIPEKIKIAVSLSDNFPESFEYITENEIEVPAEWTKFSFDLSEFKDKKIYFAVNVVSENSFCLCLDDFEISDEKFQNKTDEISYPQADCKSKKIYSVSSEQKSYKILYANEITGYEIYRNLTKIATRNNDEFSYLDTNLVSGRYVYYITAVYDTLNSYPSNQVTVLINTTGNNDDVLKLSPNPSTDFIKLEFIIDAFIESVEIYNLSGMKIYENEVNSENTYQLDVQNLQRGFYLMKIITSDDVYCKRFMKM